jgi:hypothetical protein
MAKNRPNKKSRLITEVKSGSGVSGLARLLGNPSKIAPAYR